MARRSSSGSQVLLGLLTIQPMSGYDLGQVIRDSVGHFWRESYGQIYPNLKRLAAEGLVTAKAERQEGKPDRRIYSITGKGREQLVKWLAVAPQPEIPRNELLLKLFFGAQVSPEILIGYLERMIEEERALVTQFRQAERKIAGQTQYPDAPYWRMTARFGLLELEAHLRWAQETLAELRRLANRRGAKTGKDKDHAR
jgi:PadR family transcriptional regulator AphA